MPRGGFIPAALIRPIVGTQSSSKPEWPAPYGAFPFTIRHKSGPTPAAGFAALCGYNDGFVAIHQKESKLLGVGWLAMNGTRPNSRLSKRQSKGDFIPRSVLETIPAGSSCAVVAGAKKNVLAHVHGTKRLLVGTTNLPLRGPRVLGADGKRSVGGGIRFHTAVVFFYPPFRRDAINLGRRGQSRGPAILGREVNTPIYRSIHRTSVHTPRLQAKRFLFPCSNLVAARTVSCSNPEIGGADVRRERRATAGQRLGFCGSGDGGVYGVTISAASARLRARYTAGSSPAQGHSMQHPRAIQGFSPAAGQFSPSTSGPFVNHTQRHQPAGRSSICRGAPAGASDAPV